MASTLVRFNPTSHETFTPNFRAESPTRPDTPLALSGADEQHGAGETNRRAEPAAHAGTPVSHRGIFAEVRSIDGQIQARIDFRLGGCVGRPIDTNRVAVGGLAGQAQRHRTMHRRNVRQARLSPLPVY
jgi:hypothetical protein